jgi:hypothetical protein
LNDADPASLNFDGTFISSGMFPSLKEKLHTMPDKSLGFEHTVPNPVDINCTKVMENFLV